MNGPLPFNGFMVVGATVATFFGVVEPLPEWLVQPLKNPFL